MRSSKSTNLTGLIVFVLIAALLFGIISVSAVGWQSMLPDEPDISDSDNDNSPSGEDNTQTDENNDGQGTTDSSDKAPIIVTPKYFDYLSGLTTTAEASRLRPYFVSVSSDNLYGISKSPLVMEFPTESETTKLLMALKTDTVHSKIGSISWARNYMLSLCASFGGIPIYNGLNAITGESHTSLCDIDFSKLSGYYYTENNNVYTNSHLLDAYAENSNLDRNLTGSAMPFNFSETEIYFTNGSAANEVFIPYSATRSIRLQYVKESGEYIYQNGYKPVYDGLDSKPVSFKNVFILFCDSTTYDKACGTELVLDTHTSGTGYYVTGGKSIRINWTVNDLGEITYHNESGEKLTVNSGYSYIGYFKSSRSDEVKVV